MVGGLVKFGDGDFVAPDDGASCYGDGEADEAGSDCEEGELTSCALAEEGGLGFGGCGSWGSLGKRLWFGHVGLEEGHGWESTWR